MCVMFTTSFLFATCKINYEQILRANIFEDVFIEKVNGIDRVLVRRMHYCLL